jgi:hypothetical protein
LKYDRVPSLFHLVFRHVATEGSASGAPTAKIVINRCGTIQ